MIRSICFVSVSLIGALAGTALADGVVRMSAGPSGLAGGNGGGAFTATWQSGGFVGTFTGPGSSNTAAVKSFQTFCLQINEHVSLPGTYNAAVRNHTVAAGLSNWDPVTGSYGTDPGQDQLSTTTALLYSTFRSGGNFGGNFSGAYSSTLTTALQLAIWYSEGELRNATTVLDQARYNSFRGSSSGNINTGLASNLASSDTLAEKLFFWAKENRTTSMHGVAVIVLTSGPSNATQNQDMLTMVPLPPAAYAGIGTLAGVFGLGYLRRRRLANV